MRQLHIVTDLQFGSTGKGLFCGYLAKNLRPDTIVTAWAPNAGHTLVDEHGNKYVNIALPSGILYEPKYVLLGPGSVINPPQLFMEMDRYAGMGIKPQICIHENAAVVGEHHRGLEAEYGYKIGSTMKGVGEAVIQKIRRDPSDMNTAKYNTFLTERGLVIPATAYNTILDSANTILLEGAQGFSLSINQGFYPYVTSRDCTTHQLMSDCAIPYNFMSNGRTTVYGVCRTFPIRVANRLKPNSRNPAESTEVGWSGPGYPDQQEIRWESIGQEPELTTVTKLPRRLFTFSREQVAQAVRMNGVDEIFLNFCNYATTEQLNDIIDGIKEDTGTEPHYYGWGPSDVHVKPR